VEDDRIVIVCIVVVVRRNVLCNLINYKLSEVLHQKMIVWGTKVQYVVFASWNNERNDTPFFDHRVSSGYTPSVQWYEEMLL
jgi:hypothetical protein